MMCVLDKVRNSTPVLFRCLVGEVEVVARVEDDLPTCCSELGRCCSSPCCSPATKKSSPLTTTTTTTTTLVVDLNVSRKSSTRSRGRQWAAMS